MKYSLSNIHMRNYLTASSSPLTESLERLQCCKDAGFSSAILKSAAAYKKTGTGYGRKVVYVEDGYYADASFEREILTLEEGLELYKRSLELCSPDMFLIPSVTASSLDPEEWIESCKQFELYGAQLLQLDFFYLGTMKHDNAFYGNLRNLLTNLVKTLNCNIMPKLNLRFEPDQICQVLKESGVKTISLLDSMREDPDYRLGLHKGTTSYFGSRQLPHTLRYLKVAKQYELEVCAGGGITSKSDVEQLLTAGANMIQVASYILRRDFSAVKDLLDNGLCPQVHSKRLSHNPWCDCESGAKCENCGACVANNAYHLI